MSPSSLVRAISTSWIVTFTLGYGLLPTYAQVIGDQTLDSHVDENLIITGGKEAGQNLFHSFSEFSVPADSTVYFDNNIDIKNIFSRVTGGSISNIDGLIKANGTASLFLLNPAGIIFGPNAQLDVGGSFIATTAEEIVFPEGVYFSAVKTDTPPMLSINIPLGLQYGQSPGKIITKGIEVPNPSPEDPAGTKASISLQTPDNTLALVGGTVQLEQTELEATGGRLEIGSVGNEEFVTLRPNHHNWVFDYEGVDQFSPVELDTSTIISGNGGRINIRGQDIILNKTVIVNPTLSKQDGGEVNLIANNSIVLDRSVIASQVGTGDPDPEINFINAEITGKGGNILLQGKQILMSNASRIGAETFALGDGGTITLKGKESIKLSKLSKLSGQIEIDEETSSPSISTNTGGPASGGEINIETSSLILEDEGIIESRAEKDGNGGKINITTDTLVLFDFSKITASAKQGNGGNIQINTQGLFAASGIEEQITADSQVGINGQVEINTPKADSEIDTIVVERSPLAVENLIYTGCSLGKEYIKNKFTYIGRGGLPLNPMREIATEDLMVDLGKVELPKNKGKMNPSHSPLKEKPSAKIREATSWIVNQKGNIELISSTAEVASSFTCPFTNKNMDID